MEHNFNDIILYDDQTGKIKVEVLYNEETFWLTLNKIAELFGSSKQNISYHLQNIFVDGELQQEATVKEILTVQMEGGREVSRKLEYFNLDVIIAVGYRVNSKQATQFRIWAINTLKQLYPSPTPLAQIALGLPQP
jgi:hypothetical protein